MLNRRQLASLKSWLIPLSLFALALAVRIPGLDTFSTIDEHIWIGRSQQFTAGLLFPDYKCLPPESGRQSPTAGLGCTFQTTYPAITTMWGGGLGLLAYYWQIVRPTGVDLRTFLDTPDLLDPAVLAATRLPLAVAAALFVLLFYLLMRRLLGEKVALITALLVALNPFHIALSRVLGHDALAAHFTVLALLSMAGYWLQGWKRRWLLISAVLAGLAFLTKQVSWFLLPCAAMIGLLGLYERRRRGEWRGWASLGQVIGEGVLWGAVAWLIFVALFPAMWVTPGEVIQRTIEGTLAATEQGHERDQFFLDTISRNPGPLLYPLGWLLEASPWEILGLLVLPIAAWHSLRSPRRPLVDSLRQKLAEHPVPMALALFVVTFLVFETLSNKKAVRYFLPAFPVIDIFVAIGLLWLAGRLARLSRKETIQRWALPALCGLVLLGQGWLVADNYPYYFTYYNPLLGGAPGAARIIDVGWGEGLNEVGDYLNRQPGSQSLQVASDYPITLKPFFAGEVDDNYTSLVDEVMKSDYVVFYRRHLQSRLHDPNLWRYFDQHYKPVKSVTLQGLDYALIYRNPVEQHVCTQDNNLPEALTPFGYSLAADGTLTLFWQNLKGGDQLPEVRAGLTSAADGETHWVACAPAPAFAAEAGAPGAFVESRCPLRTSGVLPGYYDLRLGWGDGGRSLPLLVDADQHFTSITPATALASLAEQGLVAPLDIAFGDRVGLVGYRLEPAAWRAGSDAALVLYWQIRGALNSSLADQFELSLRLFPPGAAEPILTTPHPILPRCLEARDLAPGTVVPVRYSRSLPTSLSPGAYTLKACLTTPGGGQVVTGMQSGAAQPPDCLPLPVSVAR